MSALLFACYLLPRLLPPEDRLPPTAPKNALIIPGNLLF